MWHNTWLPVNTYRTYIHICTCSCLHVPISWFIANLKLVHGFYTLSYSYKWTEYRCFTVVSFCICTYRYICWNSYTFMYIMTNQQFPCIYEWNKEILKWIRNESSFVAKVYKNITDLLLSKTTYQVVNNRKKITCVSVEINISRQNTEHGLYLSLYKYLKY